VYGVLCLGGARTGQIQVLVSGATEGGPAYWDFPAGAGPAALREQYSYMAYAADAGYDALSIDRIGTGRSGHPPAHEVTIPSNAYVVHQVVDALRAGAIGDHAYTTVLGAGRSLGASVIYETSVDYGGLDGVIVESFRQHRQPAFALFPLTFEPAQVEARFASVPPGYITTRPGTRADVFFYRPNADDDVIAIEESTKETITTGEIATFPPSFDYTKLVSVPVISLVGEYDALFCSGAGCPESPQEADAFPLAQCYEGHVVADAGHDMNLQRSARTDVFPVLVSWVARNFGLGAVPCSPSP
jgi:pimeloyl-ACP methyl ester carboxylesterase